jgi:hypothetical protein
MQVLLVIGWIATLVVLLWGVRRISSGDLAVVLGVLVIWAVDLSTASCYFFLVVRPPQDPDVQTWYFQLWTRDFHWPIIIALVVAPGVWIGWAARSPLLTAVASLLIMEALFLLSTVLGRVLSRGPDRGKPLDPLPVAQRAVLFRDRAVMLLAAMVAGVALRALFRL